MKKMGRVKMGRRGADRLADRLITTYSGGNMVVVAFGFNNKYMLIQCCILNKSANQTCFADLFN